MSDTSILISASIGTSSTNGTTDEMFDKRSAIRLTCTGTSKNLEMQMNHAPLALFIGLLVFFCIAGLTSAGLVGMLCGGGIAVGGTGIMYLGKRALGD